MRDRVPIAAGLLVFVVLFTVPVWHGLAARTAARQPELKLPATEKHCVAPVEYMRRAHMQMLLDWREAAVRRGERTFVAYDGRRYNISLTQTCLGQCHVERKDFCDRCHQYAGVQGPYCFDCHADRMQKTVATGAAETLALRGMR
jgi:hypothetical protein